MLKKEIIPHILTPLNLPENIWYCVQLPAVQYGWKDIYNNLKYNMDGQIYTIIFNTIQMDRYIIQ